MTRSPRTTEPTGSQRTAEEERREAAVRRYQNGDSRAFAQVFDAYYPMVSGVLFKLMGDNRDMEDVIQTVFLEVHRCIHRFEWQSRFSTWVYRIAVNVALQHMRREKLRRPVDTGEREPWLQLMDPDNPERSVIHRETFDRIQAILSQIPVKKRVVFVLSDIQGLGAEQISEVLDLPRKKVYARLFQARRTFHEKVKRDPYFQERYGSGSRGTKDAG